MRVSGATRESFSARLRVSDGDSPAATNVGKRNIYLSPHTQGESALYGLLPVVEDLPRQSGSACCGENGRCIHTYIHT